MQFTASELGLEDVSGIHRPLGSGTGTGDGVHFVDEDDEFVLVRCDLIDHLCQPLFEVAAVSGPRDHARQVELHDAFACETIGHVAVDDPLSETFDDGGLADTGLAYQHRVVLCTSRQDLDGLFDLVGTADDRVDAPTAGFLGQVESELVQRRGGCRGLSSDRAALKCGLQVFGCDAGSGEQTTRSPVMVGSESEEQMFWIDVRRAQGLGELVSLEHGGFQCSAQ